MEVLTRGTVERRKTFFHDFGVTISSVRAGEYLLDETMVFINWTAETESELAIIEIVGKFDDHDEIAERVHDIMVLGIR